MSALLPLRSYQRAALDAVTEALREVRRPAVVLPTGGGKTVCFAHQVSEWLDQHPDTRALVLVHTDELVQQAHRKITDVAPHLVTGIVKAKRNDVRADVIVASVRTLRSAARRAQIQRVSLVIVDECHHATAPTYRAILDHYADAVAVGYTATLERGDGGPLGQVWQRVAFTRDIPWMVRKRYLIPPRGLRVQVPALDLTKVKRAGGDFHEGELGEAIVGSLAPELIAQSFVEHASGRKAIAFLPTVASAEVMRDAFRDHDVSAEVLHGKLSGEDRTTILKRFAAGEVRVLVNCVILTEGFDAPDVSCVIVARPTQSRPLYIQMVGRGLRVDPARPYDEQDCLLMDVVGVTGRMSLRSMADLSEKDVKPPRDGQTLLDLEDEFDAGEGVEPDAPEHYRGPVEVSEFDPLAARSSRNWLRTTGGAFFLPAGKAGYVFLVQGAPGTWSVAWATKSHRQPWVCPSRMHEPDCTSRHGKVGGTTQHQGLDLEMAMTWGEDLAVDMGADPGETLVRKAAPWRRKPASSAARDEANRLGITFPESIRAGDLSDLITKIKASSRIDPIVAAIKKQQEARSDR